VTAAISLLIIVSLSFLIVRIGTIALTMTGLSEDIASFQSLSAFSGVGFTTDEAETVLVTAARRRIVKMLIRLGSVGVVTAISSLFLSLTDSAGAISVRLAVIIAGLILLVLLSRNQWFQRILTPLIRKLLQRTGAVHVHDYASLLRMREGYGVSEVEVTTGSWLAGGTLRQLRPRAEGVTVLGIIRNDGQYIGAPQPDEPFEPGDRLILYGQTDRLREISARHAGDETKHDSAVREHDREVAREQRRDDSGTAN